MSAAGVAGPQAASPVANEQVKLLANALNTAATSSFTVGVLAPIAAAIYTSAATAPPLPFIASAAAGWIFLAIVLHLAARRVLRRLRP